MASRAENIHRALEELTRASADIVACMVISADGLPIASVLPSGVDEAKVAAMAAAMSGVAEKVVSELNVGPFHQVYVKGEGGGVVVTSINPDADLVVVVRRDAKLGLVLYEIGKAVKRIQEML